ncbi:MAG: TetR/AcrR family transcriptional regulator [Caldilineaceae bacterium]
MKKQPELTALTRENLIEAFWSLYRQKKIEQISIKEITDKAGYNRSTFYEYFVDIYDLLEQLEAALLTHMRETALKTMPLRQEADIIQRMAEVYEEKGYYLSVLLGENRDPEFANKIKAIMRPALKDLFGLVEDEIHTGYIFEFASSAMLATITHWYKSGKNLPSQELISLVRSMLTGGVFPVIRQYARPS